MQAWTPLPLLAVALLAGCNRPPQQDGEVARVPVAERDGPLAPIASPDTTGATWAPGLRDPSRLFYGKPGEPPLFALACELRGGEAILGYTRFADADARAKAILALIGNRHVARWKIDAVRDGKRWIWQGSVPAWDPGAEVLTGTGKVEATVPGAGSVILNESALPGAFVTRCRSLAPPAALVSAPAATAAAQSGQPDTTDTEEPPPPPAR